MYQRKIQLISNIYKGKSEDKDIEALGEYCVFGPFDALSFEEEEQGTDEPAYYDDKDKIREKCRCFHITCVSDEDDKEKQFFKRAALFPFLFVSFFVASELGNGNYDINADHQDIRNKIRIVNLQNPNCRICFSYEKYSFILFHLCNQYKEGLKKILEIEQLFPKAKSSTVFAVREDALDTQNELYEAIRDDKVGVRLQGIMTDKSRADDYLSKLGKMIMGFSKPAERIAWYDTLGSADILVEIDGVFLKEVLPLYKSGSFLTHMCHDYQNAWYNIETKFIIERDHI